MEWVDILRAMVSLLFVMGLIVGFAYIWRKYGNGQWMDVGGKERRLKIVEILPLDGRNRLALVQRDKEELLLLLSQDGHSVIAGPDKAAVMSSRKPKKTTKRKKAA